MKLPNIEKKTKQNKKLPQTKTKFWISSVWEFIQTFLQVELM